MSSRPARSPHGKLVQLVQLVQLVSRAGMALRTGPTPSARTFALGGSLGSLGSSSYASSAQGVLARIAFRVAVLVVLAERTAFAEDRGVALVSPALGRALDQNDAGGWAGRIEIGGLNLPSRGVTDAFYGGSLGVAAWKGSHRGGCSFPLHMLVGVESSPFFASVGGGLLLFDLDELGHHGGTGLFAPFASISVGVTFHDLRVAADMRPAWRWKHLGDATTQGQNEVMLMVGIPFGGSR